MKYKLYVVLEDKDAIGGEIIVAHADCPPMTRQELQDCTEENLCQRFILPAATHLKAMVSDRFKESDAAPATK